MQWIGYIVTGFCAAAPILVALLTWRGAADNRLSALERRATKASDERDSQKASLAAMRNDLTSASKDVAALQKEERLSDRIATLDRKIDALLQGRAGGF